LLQGINHKFEHSNQQKINSVYRRLKACIYSVLLLLLQPTNSIFLSHQTSTSHQSASSNFLSQQTSTRHQPQPAEQSDSSFKNYALTKVVIIYQSK